MDTIAGDFIALFNKGSHQCFRAFVQYVDEVEISPEFYGVSEIDLTIVEKLSG